MSKKEADGVASIADAMARLGCSRWKIYALARESRLELVKFDSRTKVTERSLQRLLQEIHSKPVERKGAA